MIIQENQPQRYQVKEKLWLRYLTLAFLLLLEFKYYQTMKRYPLNPQLQFSLFSIFILKLCIIISILFSTHTFIKTLIQSYKIWLIANCFFFVLSILFDTERLKYGIAIYGLYIIFIYIVGSLDLILLANLQKNIEEVNLQEQQQKNNEQEMLILNQNGEQQQQANRPLISSNQPQQQVIQVEN